MKAILDFFHSTRTQAFLAYIILIGGGLILKFGGLADNDRNRLWDILFLTATFYFGSSKSGATKDETIASMAATNSAPAKTES